MRREALAILAMLAMPACKSTVTEQGVFVTVTAGSALPDIVHLRVSLSNRNAPSTTLLFPNAEQSAAIHFPTTFSFDVPTSRNGEVDIAVEGLNASLLVVANGTTTALLKAKTFVNASVTLQVGASLCGNNQLDSGESCDDGNRFSGDGCDFLCRVEGVADSSVAPDVVARPDVPSDQPMADASSARSETPRSDASASPDVPIATGGRGGTGGAGMGGTGGSGGGTGTRPADAAAGEVAGSGGTGGALDGGSAASDGASERGASGTGGASNTGGIGTGGLSGTGATSSGGSSVFATGGSGGSATTTVSGCTTDLMTLRSDNWIPMGPQSCGVQGAIYAYGDGSTCSSPSPISSDACQSGSAGCCISGTTIIDPTYANWGCGLGFDFSNSGGGPKSPYAGSAKGFTITISGTVVTGQRIRISYLTVLPAADGVVPPFVDVTGVGTYPVLFTDVTCPSWAAPGQCTPVSESGPYQLHVELENTGSASEPVGPFTNVCITSIVPITNG